MNSIECDLPALAAPGPAYVWTSPATAQCGFPSPAEDHTREQLDISRLLVRQPDATFFVRVRGPSMRDAGIDEGDYVVVDRSATPKHGSIVLAVVDGEFTIKRLHRRAGRVRLCAANPTYPDIEIRDAQELSVWGVVTWTLKQRKGGSEVLSDTRTQTASFAAASAAFWDLYAQPFDTSHLLLMSKDNKQINAYRYGSQPGERDHLAPGTTLNQ